MSPMSPRPRPAPRYSPTPAAIEALQMRARARCFVHGGTHGLRITRVAIAELVARFGERRDSLDTGDRILNDAAIRELTAAVVGKDQAAPA